MCCNCWKKRNPDFNVCNVFKNLLHAQQAEAEAKRQAEEEAKRKVAEAEAKRKIQASSSSRRGSPGSVRACLPVHTQRSPPLPLPSGNASRCRAQPYTTHLSSCLTQIMALCPFGSDAELAQLKA
jgi:hypothetical protein